MRDVLAIGLQQESRVTEAVNKRVIDGVPMAQQSVVGD